MGRVELDFVQGVKVRFVGRDRGLKQVEEFARRGTGFPVVIYGPEGCGKTAFFKQAMRLFEEYEYVVTYFSPLEEQIDNALYVTKSVRDLVKEVLDVVITLIGKAEFAEAVFRLIIDVLRHSRSIAVIADDVFQAIGLDRAEPYVKKLLNIIEYPPKNLERIVVLVGSSEGVTRGLIGRHNWAHIKAMWNLPKKDLQELYEQIPNNKPSFEDIWRSTGGNPRILRDLYLAGWNTGVLIKNIIEGRKLVRFINSLTQPQREALESAVEDPDVLIKRLRDAQNETEKRMYASLIDELVKLNMVMDEVPFRDEHLWIDAPPLEKDLDLGIGERYAWQTPIHKEAVKRALAF